MALDESSACPFGGLFAQVWFTTTLSTGNAFRLRDSIAGLDFELRFSRTTTTTWNPHILFPTTLRLLRPFMAFPSRDGLRYVAVSAYSHIF